MGEPTIQRILGQKIFCLQLSLDFFVDYHKLGVFKKSLQTKLESMTSIAGRLYFYL